jgi:ABC-type branched-subunit amino acid transport system ATPase component
MTAPLVEMRDMVKSFGGIKAVDHVTIDLSPVKWSAFLVTTAPASRC